MLDFVLVFLVIWLSGVLLPLLVYMAARALARLRHKKKDG